MIPSGLIGRHSLEAWGYRLGKHKGDYVKDMEAKGLDPWAAWNPDMEEYCALDVEVTTTLWENILQQGLHPTAEALEHEVHTVCAEMERNGFPFDRAEALKLVSRLEQDRDVLREKIVGEYGLRMRPERKIHVRPQWYDPDGVQRKKEMSGVFPRPNSEWHEDLSRPWWGEITTPKRSMKRKVGDQVREYTEGAPYCKGTLQEFNPGSRQQVVEILTSEHGWVPTEFTEGGSPSVDSGALKKLSETVPIAKDLDELFFVEKLLGQMVNGPQSWLNSYKEDTGCLHCYIDTGGTVTGRCTHSRPNLGQVPGVIAVASKFETHEEDGSKNKKLLNKDGTWKSWVPAVDGSIPFEVNNPALFGPDGKFYPEAYDFHGKLKKEGPLLGRVGEYGWECRSLFRVPDGWFQLGVDLSGIEFRALAHLTAEFDGGELVEVVLTGDIHAYNQSKTGIPTRDIVKRVLYGLLYGAGDYKLGITVKATASYSEAVSIGARLRAQLMEGLPALNEAMKKVKTEAARGFITGLDGRKIKVRSEHSALNTRLQSDAAIIAKRWVCLTRQNAGATGANCGWDGDFVMMAFVHDEIQMAAHPLFAKELAQICKDAAKTAGEEFGFRCPVDADAKLGYSWAQCH
jgi:DNA polymerase I-like protein with 3'-5' exonuclease and polymerase domains